MYACMYRRELLYDNYGQWLHKYNVIDHQHVGLRCFTAGIFAGSSVFRRYNSTSMIIMRSS